MAAWPEENQPGWSGRCNRRVARVCNLTRIRIPIITPGSRVTAGFRYVLWDDKEEMKRCSFGGGGLGAAGDRSVRCGSITMRESKSKSLSTAPNLWCSCALAQCSQIGAPAVSISNAIRAKWLGRSRKKLRGKRPENPVGYGQMEMQSRGFLSPNIDKRISSDIKHANRRVEIDANVLSDFVKSGKAPDGGVP
ncbi:hypothetical protein KM043_005039 [Ampulex compressa]|nr:hypothetical protein KM043_005039 [Ampulex compressa]